MKLQKLTGFPLVQIDENFHISDFERKLYPSHVRGIKKAIMDGTLVDNVITVHVKKGGKWDVIDGQHRLVALKALLAEKKLRTYSLYIRKAVNIKERDAYLAINKGKSLNHKDILKSYDDGKIYFFTGLNDVCSHYGGINTLPFVDLLYAYAYSKSGNPFARRENIAKYVCDIEDYEIKRLNTMIHDAYMVFGRNTKLYYYRAVIFRNLVRIYFEHFEDFQRSDKIFQKFLKKLRDDRFLYANQTMKSVESYGQVYFYLKNKIDKYMKS